MTILKILATWALIIGFEFQLKAQSPGDLILNDPPLRECHASTIIEISMGEFLIAFFGGKYEGSQDVKIWAVRGSTGHWGKPEIVADGAISPDSSLPCWNPVLYKMPDGQILLFYKVGKNPREWFGMSKSSNDGGRTWSEPGRLPNGILGPIRSKPVMNSAGLLLCPSSVETTARWWVTMEIFDPVKNLWSIQDIDRNSPFDVIQPTILELGDNRFRILCRSKQNKVVTSLSEDSGLSWGTLETIPLINPNAGIDAIHHSNGKYYLVYNPAVAGREWFHGRNQLSLAVSDDCIHWKDIMVLENHPSGEYSYPAIIEGSDGKLHITYTYARSNICYRIAEPML
jgi:alpha-L-fucosidase